MYPRKVNQTKQSFKHWSLFLVEQQNFRIKDVWKKKKKKKKKNGFFEFYQIQPWKSKLIFGTIIFYTNVPVVSNCILNDLKCL